ncbi:MAG: hypothetical protein IJ643_11420 [Eubacterium sp.]|nr:hypothetical protein [Eubacterium sp.]
MPTILIEVGRSTLYGTSTKKPTVKKVTENSDNDNNYYQAAVEALYDDIDLPSAIGFTYFQATLLIPVRRALNMLAALFQRTKSRHIKGVITM